MDKQTNTVHTKPMSPDAYGALNMPVYHSAAFGFPTAKAMADAFAGRSSAPTYSRVTNPTVTFFEERVRELSVGSGRDADNDPLPLISPVGWQTQIGVSRGQWQAQITVRGNARQSQYAAKYGETETPAWTICNLSALWQKPIGDKRLSVRAGVENLFDKRYATYADWNQIPQKGRNIFANLTFEM